MEDTQLNPPRLYYLDNLRVFLTVLVVLHHTAITYGASGSWYYYATIHEGLNDPLTTALLTIVVALNSSFFLAAFFLLSGYFTPGSYDRKGTLAYLKDRFIRLGIPLIMYIIIIEPFIILYRWVTLNDVETTLGEFYIWILETGTIGVGPLWFVQTLLLFAICYSILVIFNRRRVEKEFLKNREEQESQKRDFPNSYQIFSLIALVGILTFLVRIFIPSDTPILFMPLGDFVAYITMFSVGVFAYRQDWISKITETHLKFWLKVAIGAIIFLLAYISLTGAFEGDTSAYQGGFSFESLLGSVWGAIMCISVCLSLVPIFRTKLNNNNPIAQILSQNAYTVYIIHAPVLVVTSISVAGIILHPLVKFIFVLCITLTLCFVISHFVLRRIPGAKKVLG